MTQPAISLVASLLLLLLLVNGNQFPQSAAAAFPIPDDSPSSQHTAATQTSPTPTSLVNLINGIIDIIQLSQINLDQGSAYNGTTFPPHFELLPGLYPSSIRFNFAYMENADTLRSIGLPDTNGFATAFIMQFLMDQIQVVGDLKQTLGIRFDTISDEHFCWAVSQLFTFHNVYHNGTVPLNGEIFELAPVYDFWPDELGSSGWLQNPDNLIGIINLFTDPSPQVNATMLILESIFPWLASLVQQVQDSSFIASETGMSSDFDDSALHLLVGTFLHETKELFPKAYNLWLNGAAGVNRLTQNLFDAIWKYRYDPFSNNTDLNTIDDRTYMWLHPFLDSMVLNNGNSTTGLSINLIGTWVQNATELQAGNSNYENPEGVQDVDPTIVSNVLLSMFKSLTSNNPEINVNATQQVLTLLKDNIDLICWVHDTNIQVERPDIVSLFYPNTFTFYYFSSRILQYLSDLDTEPFYESQPQLHKILIYSRDALATTMQTSSTNFLLSNVTVSNGEAHWDDFLGLNDLPTPHFCDRMYSTALAVNTLFSIWATGKGSTFRFLPSTPQAVKTTIEAAVLFLQNNIFRASYPLDGPFFSGSQHSSQGLGAEPISGYLTPAVYFNQTYTPITFSGTNSPDGNYWPYWTSPGFTLAIINLPLTKYAVLTHNEQ